MEQVNTDLLKKIPFFSSLSDDELKKISEIIKQNEYRQGDIIIKEDDLVSANTFYIIYKGRVEVIKNYGEIEELVITLKESGEFFGEISLIDDKPRTATIRASVPTSMYEINRKDLNHILYAYPDLMYKIMKELSLNLRDSDKMLIENLKEKNRLLSNAYLETIKVIINALELRDRYLKGHTARVTMITKAIGKLMGCSKEDFYILETGSLLHDIGKIGIPDNILHKSGPLDKDEFSFIQLHPQKGKQMLKDISFLKEVIPSILYHHERFDGSGYPEHLKKNDIPMAARIIAVADAFDAMTTDRSYRKAMSHEDAIKELKTGIDTQFDPEVLATFIKLHESGELKRLYDEFYANSVKY